MNFFHLPRHLWWPHHLAFLLHDHLAQTVVRGEQEELFMYEFKFKDEEERQSFESISHGGVIDWMQNVGRTSEASNVIERTLIHDCLLIPVSFYSKQSNVPQREK